MATEVENKAAEAPKTETKWQSLMKIAEFRMLLYVIPVGLVVLVLALLLGK